MKKTILLVLVLALGLIAPVANADFTFGTPTNIGPTVNSSAYEICPSISADGLELFFAAKRPGGHGYADIYVATRETTENPSGEPVNLGPSVNSSSSDNGPSISADGLSLYFHSNRSGGFGGEDIWVTTRATKADPWGTPVNLGPPVNSSAGEIFPSISADGLQLYFSEWELFRPGGYGGGDIWVAARETTNDDWGTPVNLGPTVNSSSYDDGPSISADDLSLFFGSNRPGGYGVGDLYVATRATVSDPWGTPVNLGPTVNSSDWDEMPDISADGSTIFFMSNRPGGVGGYDIYQAPIIPIVDFNGDEIVDLADLVILIEHWGTSESLCDIGPMPWGDGTVDVADLEVLMSYWQQEVLPVELVAYWKLDETEGDIAYDSVGVYDGVLNGVPTWQPTGGQIDGALAFDGTDDYVSTPFVLNPAKGAFSVFAWIKGGAPGQLIISQTDGTGTGETWLGTERSDGKLMSGLVPPPGGRFVPQPLVSEFIITDGAWHRVGFVWDGSNRILYADGAEAARDTQSGLETSEGGLNLGAGKNLEPGSFFSGLIDDVRIYNRAVTP